MSFRIKLAAGVVLGWGIALAAIPVHAQVQPQTPQVASPQGTIEAVKPGMVKIATTGGDSWMVRIPPTAEIMVTGTAKPDFLKTGLCIEFLAEVNRRGKAQNKIEKLGIFTPSDLKFLGAFPEAGFAGQQGAVGQDAKNTAGAVSRYKVCGRITGMKKGKFTVNYGTGTVEIELADEVIIDLAVADYRFAKPGDKISCTGIQVGEKMLQATRVNIEMAEPLSAAVKRSRHPKPPRKPDSAESSGEKTNVSEKLASLLTPKEDAQAGETFRIEGDPTEFKLSVRGPALTLQKRFGRPKRTSAKGLWKSDDDAEEKPVRWQLWTWGSVKVVVDKSKKARFFAVESEPEPEPEK